MLVLVNHHKVFMVTSSFEIWLRVSKVMKVQILFNEGSNFEQTYEKTDNANVLVLVYHQTESTVTSLSNLWLWVKGQKSSIMGSYLEINHYMLSICYKCKLYAYNWVNIDVTRMKWCLDEGTIAKLLFFPWDFRLHPEVELYMHSSCSYVRTCTHS